MVSQPLKLWFDTVEKRRSHTPDYLAVTRSGVWLIDVRPKELIDDKPPLSAPGVIGNLSKISRKR